MSIYQKTIITLSWCLFIHISYANVEFTFSSIDNEQRAMALLKVLRCPQCQNQNLAESNSELTLSLQQDIFNQVEQGYTDHAIIEQMVMRYGDFIRYDPPLASRTVLLWFGPLLFLILLTIGCFWFYRNNHKTHQADQADQADQAEG